MEYEILEKNDKISFSCQNCGFKCCSAGYMQQVYIPPYSIAYLWKLHGKDYVMNLLKSDDFSIGPGNSTLAPVINFTAKTPYCPFLEIEFKNQYITDTFITTFGDMKESTFEKVLLTSFLNTTNNSIQKNSDNNTSRTSANKIVEVTYSSPALIYLVQGRREISNNSIEDILMEFSEKIDPFFEKHNKSKDFTFRCKIYEALPTVCFLYPLGRNFGDIKIAIDPKKFGLTEKDLKDESKVLEAGYKYHFVNYEQTTGDAEYFIQNKNSCPKEAWKGKECKLKDILDKNNFDFNENDYWMYIIAKFMWKNKDKINRENLANTIFNGIFSKCYMEIEYDTNRKTYYKKLKDHLNEYLENLDRLLNKKMTSIYSKNGSVLRFIE